MKVKSFLQSNEIMTFCKCYNVLLIEAMVHVTFFKRQGSIFDVGMGVILPVKLV